MLEISTNGKVGTDVKVEGALGERGEVWKDVGGGVEAEGLGRTGGAVEGAGESIVHNAEKLEFGLRWGPCRYKKVCTLDLSITRANLAQLWSEVLK